MTAASRKGILTAGTWCVDRNKLVDCWPQEDGLAEILEEEPHGGGSACNLAINVRSLDPDVPVATIGLVGNDLDGQFLLSEADRHGIDRQGIKVIPQATTHYTDAYASKQSGRRVHLTHLGASRLLTPDHIDVSRCTHRILHLGIVGVHPAMDAAWKDAESGWAAVLRQARAHGLTTNLEMAGFASEKLAAATRPCLPYLDLLIVNDSEIGAIAGISTLRQGQADPDRCIEAASRVLTQGTARLVAVHFPKGAIVVTRDKKILTKPSVAAPKAAVVGANGAGDAFAAGFLYAVHEHWELEDALRLAHAAAAASLRHLSTTYAVEHWKACLALADQWGWRTGLV